MDKEIKEILERISFDIATMKHLAHETFIRITGISVPIEEFEKRESKRL